VKVVAITGGAEKIKLLKDRFGVDVAVDYKEKTTVKEMRAALREAAPEGFDYYMDGVGGYQTEAVWDLLNQHARVAICGQISGTEGDAPKSGQFLRKSIYKEIRVQGIVVGRYRKDRELLNAFNRDVAKWYGEGKMHPQLTIVDGFEAIPEAFNMLFGENSKKKGKLIVKF